MFFVEGLCDLKGALGGKRRFALQGGEIVKLWRNLRDRFFFLRNFAGLALATGLDRLGGELVPNSLGLGKWR